jgi:hypothetical protein
MLSYYALLVKSTKKLAVRENPTVAVVKCEYWGSAY